MEITSGWKDAPGKINDVFNFASDLNNMGILMPEQVINWKADTDTCSFTIKGMTNLSLRLDEIRPNRLIRLVPNGKSPFEFDLVMHFREIGEEQTQIKVELNAELNPMLAMMAKRPLQNLVNIIAEKLSYQKF
ncbi:MAG: hypothetical protein CVT92_13535 [Bacteroidetes bacterium HGW-Bacteroidetes-1]|jgi:carbon monoxide dehydrogenase subunit G|nr:MAG: hypothetical protein CVT92_13535 [Bacteroidetes bacterium HGW-Bacteroidetes-1]